jgi:hypothetical protein
MNILLALFFLLGPISAADLPPPVTVDGSGDCPSGGCGLNGPRLTGLTVDFPGRVAAVRLPSGELITLR